MTDSMQARRCSVAIRALGKRHHSGTDLVPGISESRWQQRWQDMHRGAQGPFNISKGMLCSPSEFQLTLVWTS